MLQNILKNRFGKMAVFLAGFLVITFFFFGWDWGRTMEFMAVCAIWIVIFFLFVPNSPESK